MNFLTSTDIDSAIKANRLTPLLDGLASPDANMTDAETKAISMMQGYLNARYDVNAIFSAIGADRHPIIVKYCTDIMLYYLYSRLQSEQVPELRVENYATAERWLRGVNKCEINPPNMPILDGGVKDYVTYGGRTPSSHFID